MAAVPPLRRCSHPRGAQFTVAGIPQGGALGWEGEMKPLADLSARVGCLLSSYALPFYELLYYC